jgi:hypothetical protein
MMTLMKNRWFAIVAACLTCATLLGCGAKKPAGKAVQGDVVYGGAKVPLGTVKFVSVEGSAPQRIAPIVDGRYCIDSTDAVPLGKWRVEVDARQKTGRKVKSFNGIENAMVDEKVRLGPDAYADGRSPLIVEIDGAFDGKFDITIPRQ